MNTPILHSSMNTPILHSSMNTPILHRVIYSGFRMEIHAIGDACAEQVVNSFTGFFHENGIYKLSEFFS